MRVEGRIVVGGGAGPMVQVFIDVGGGAGGMVQVFTDVGGGAGCQCRFWRWGW